MGCKSRFYVDIMDLHNQVTGSCHLCVVKLPNDEKIKFIVDCGLFQEDESSKYNEGFTFDASEISFCLVTHNHVDHIGRLPLLTKLAFSGSIFTTKTTSILMQEALKDTCSILKSKAKLNNLPPLYAETDTEKVFEQCVPCEYDSDVYVHKNIKVNFFSNAHLPGAAMILVRISYPGYDDINILFTGDYNISNVFTYDTEIPDWVKSLPITIVQESTYGDTTTAEIEPCFDRNVLKTIEAKGTVLAPVFSLGRSQEILYRLKCLQDSGQLDTEVPIYLDGRLSIRYTSLYIRGLLDIKDEMTDFLPQNLSFVDKVIRQSLLNETNTCKIILTSSGMGSYGPARTYIPAFLGRQNMLIHFTGYTAEGTLGRKLKDTPAEETVAVAGMLIKKRAKVEYTSEFSAHAKADQMLDFLKQFTNLRLVLVNHGSTETKKKFAKRILKEVDTKYVGILDRDNLFRIDTWGFMKTIPTKFI